MDTILSPIMWVVAWIMHLIHKGLVVVGFSDGAGPAWVFAIIGLTIVVRLIVLPLYNKQIRSQRQTQVIQPEIQKIQKKYKNKKDTASQRKQQEELQALYRKHGTSPFASCMPLLIQMPILFSLYRVLYAFPEIAAGRRGPLGPITKEIAQNFEDSTVFSAPLSAAFADAGKYDDKAMAVRVVAGILVILMCITMFYTQHQLMRKNLPDSANDPNNPMYRTQQIMLYGMPVMYIFMGRIFQIGVLVYWVAGNLWNVGQQAWFIHNNPTPGSKAYRDRQARLLAKRRAKGLSDEEIAELEEQDVARSQGRVQPLGKERAKKAAQKAANAAAFAGETDDVPEEVDVEEVRGKDGLTDEERARKRYERRQAERARAKAKQDAREKKAKQNQKKRNF